MRSDVSSHDLKAEARQIVVASAALAVFEAEPEVTEPLTTY